MRVAIADAGGSPEAGLAKAGAGAILRERWRRDPPAGCRAATDFRRASLFSPRQPGLAVPSGLTAGPQLIGDMRTETALMGIGSELAAPCDARDFTVKAPSSTWNQ
ncbi:MAG: hypothetical protein HUJ24_07560 [Rhodobacteraceae bacterium]|nr:hypothetical protein [Paracoccaceae bacterium]